MAQLLSGSGMFILFCIFLTLKLTGYIAWSWVWVTAPLWIGLVLVLGVFLLIFISVLIAQAFKK